MFPILLLLFVIVPLVELYVIIAVAGYIGTLETIVLLVVDSLLGAWLVRREGFGIMRQVRRELSGGKMPTNALIEGALVLGAGALMLTPGFVTDAFGLILMIPPLRALVRRGLVKRYGKNVRTYRPPPSGPQRYGDVIDVDEHFEDDPPTDFPELK